MKTVRGKLTLGNHIEDGKISIDVTDSRKVFFKFQYYDASYEEVRKSRIQLNIYSAGKSEYVHLTKDSGEEVVFHYIRDRADELEFEDFFSGSLGWKYVIFSTKRGEEKEKRFGILKILQTNVVSIINGNRNCVDMSKSELPNDIAPLIPEYAFQTVVTPKYTAISYEPPFVYGVSAKDELTPYYIFDLRDTLNCIDSKWPMPTKAVCLGSNQDYEKSKILYYGDSYIIAKSGKTLTPSIQDIERIYPDKDFTFRVVCKDQNYTCNLKKPCFVDESKTFRKWKSNFTFDPNSKRLIPAGAKS